MSINERWFAASKPGSTTLQCCFCQNQIDLKYPTMDHHPACCPACGVECLFVSWRGIMVQVVPAKAPPELAKAILWAQANLDEVEFIALCSSIEEIGLALPTEQAVRTA
jgi:hypothetical protein